MEWMPLVLFVAVCLVLMMGFPVAFSLAGTSLIIAGFGYLAGSFDGAFLSALPNRIFGILSNQILIKYHSKTINADVLFPDYS